MTVLADLIKKRSSERVATAIPAIPAIPATKIAKIATIAIANPKVPQVEDKEVSTPNRAARKFSNEELQELYSLIEYVGANNNFSNEDITEAKFHARKDVELALISFRALARTIRRDGVMGLLQASPESLRAAHIDADSDPKNIILTIGLRHVAVAEMAIPREKYTPWKMMNILNTEVH